MKRNCGRQQGNKYPGALLLLQKCTSRAKGSEVRVARRKTGPRGPGEATLSNKIE